jgi:hypothetical protein
MYESGIATVESDADKGQRAIFIPPLFINAMWKILGHALFYLFFYLPRNERKMDDNFAGYSSHSFRASRSSAGECKAHSLSSLRLIPGDCRWRVYPRGRQDFGKFSWRLRRHDNKSEWVVCNVAAAIMKGLFVPYSSL